MPLNINLPTDRADGGTGHTAGHNATNTAVNQTAAKVDEHDTAIAGKQPTGSYATTTALASGLASRAAASHTHPVDDLSVNGDRDGTKFLRDDGMWAAPTGVGNTGPAGADGRTVRSGTGAPGSGLGVDGDFYIDSAANTLYGPRTGGSWGAPTPLVGPTGATGPAGSADLPEYSASAQTAAVAVSGLASKTTRFNTTSAAISQSLPAATSGAMLAVGWDAGANALTLVTAGSDVIGSGSATSLALPLPGEVLTLHCTTAGRWRVTSGFKPQASLDARYSGGNIADAGLSVDQPLGNNLTKLGVIVPTATSAGIDNDMTESLTTLHCLENGRIAGVYTGYGTGTGVQRGTICLAWSDDGITWEKAGTLLAYSGTAGAPDQNGATGPVLVYDSGLYHLFYIGLTGTGYEGGTKTLCRATSASLVNPAWTRQGAVLTPGGSGWRAQQVWHPHIFKVGSTWYCFVNASGSDGKERIGYATATDLAGPWTFSTNPVVDVVGSDLIAGDPCVTKIRGGWRMDFFRYGPSVGIGGNAADYYAVTTDANFPTGWVLGKGGAPTLWPSETWDAQYAHKPWIMRLGGRVLHYYTAVSDAGARRVAVAVEPGPAQQLTSIPITETTRSMTSGAFAGVSSSSFAFDTTDRWSVDMRVVVRGTAGGGNMQVRVTGYPDTAVTMTGGTETKAGPWARATWSGVAGLSLEWKSDGTTNAQLAHAFVEFRWTPGMRQTVPSVPRNLAATPGNTQVALSWSASTDDIGVTGYNVRRGGNIITTVSGTSYTDTGLANSTAYVYAVTAIDAAGNESARTSTVTVTPSAGADTTAPSTPTGLTATPGDTQVALSWTASTDNLAVTGYKVRRGGTVVGTPSGTSYTDTGLTNGTQQSYTLSAVDAAGNESAQTSAVSATPVAGTPPTAADDFSGANGALAGRSTPTGTKTWQVSGGTGWAIASNAAAWSGSSDGAMLVNSGLADNYDVAFTCVSVTGNYPIAILVRGTTTSSCFKVFRSRAANNWTLADTSGAEVIRTGTPDIANGDVVKCRVQGSTVTLFQNGTEIAQWAGVTYQAGGTFQGVIGSGGLAAVVDNFSITALPQLTNTVAPAISGTASMAQTLTASTGTWSATPDSSTYQWNRAGSAISGATSSTYMVAAADVGQTVTVTVTAIKAGLTNGTATSSSATPTAGTFTNSTLPTISGTAQDGQTLTAGNGTWSQNPDSFTYVWKRAGTAISGATASTYLLATADVGSTVTVTVTAVKAGYTSVAATSAATGTVAAAAGGGGVQPDSISGLTHWFKADAITGLTNADPVASWPSSASGGAAATQATSTAWPTYRTGVLNSKPVVRFDGGDHLVAATATPTSTASVFLVVKPTTTGSQTFLAGQASNSPLVQIGGGAKLQLVKEGVIVVGESATTPSTSAFEVWSVVHGGGSWAIHRNGTADGSGSSSNTFSAAANTVIGANNGLSFKMAGDLAEVIVYNTALSGTDRTAVTTYLGTKYGITVS